MPRAFGKYLQNRVYEEGQTLHDIRLNTTPQQLALGTDSASHLDERSLHQHNPTWNLGKGEGSVESWWGYDDSTRAPWQLFQPPLEARTASPPSAEHFGKKEASLQSWQQQVLLNNTKQDWSNGGYLLGCFTLVSRDCNYYRVTAVLLVLANFVLAHLLWFTCRARVSNANSNRVSYRKILSEQPVFWWGCTQKSISYRQYHGIVQLA